MSNQSHEELNEKLVYQHLCHVTDKKSAWILLQEPGFIGFGVVRQDKIFWPPYPDMLKDWTPDWQRVSDLRLFGEKGEWHVWLDWERRHQGRLLELKKIADGLTEYHALWGTDVKPCPSPWIRLVEERGAEIWLPLADEELNPKKDLPLRLKLKQVVDYDPEYHLAGIVDAALVALVRSSDKEPIAPPSFAACT